MNTNQASRRSPALLIFCIVVIPTLLGIVAIGGFYFASLRPETTLAIGEADRLVLVTANDLQPLLPQFLVRTEWEELRKVKKHNDQSVQMTYSYVHEDDRRSFELACQVQVFPTRLSARKGFSEQDEIWLTALDDGVKPKQRADFQFGDASRQGTFLQGEEIWGYYFLCRRREKVFRVELAGLSFEDDTQFLEVLKPCLDMLDDYEP